MKGKCTREKVTNEKHQGFFLIKLIEENKGHQGFFFPATFDVPAIIRTAIKTEMITILPTRRKKDAMSLM
jgi:hypothetical protein